MSKRTTNGGFVGRHNQTKIDFIYDEASSFINGLALVSKASKSGFINPQGDIIIPLEYDDISILFYDDPNQEVVSAKKGETYYLLDKQGHAIKTDYDYIGYFTDNLAPVSEADANSPTGKSYGTINIKGELVTPLTCSED